MTPNDFDLLPPRELTPQPYSKGTPTRVGGLNTEDLGKELFTFIERAYPKPPEEAPKKLVDEGFVKASNSKEHHSNSPALAKVIGWEVDSHGS